jgi:starch-binding outer membrane protein, SusD/RagB family
MKLLSRRHLLVGASVPLVVIATAYGCKDYLTEAATPQGVLDAGTLATANGVEGSLIATYRAIETNGATGGQTNAASNWVWGSMTSDDAYKGTEASDFISLNDVQTYNWSTGLVEGELNNKWRGMYEGVSRANATLRLLKDVVANKPSEIPDVANQKGIEGEALFLRAHFHFEAYRMWGNIPYYRETDTDFRRPGLAGPAVITEILKDLDAAIGLLPTTPRRGQKGRVTQWTAKAYKGRVQMYAGQFPAALTTLREVRTSGPYKLEASYDRVWTGFQDFANGPETIFAYQASVNDGEPNGENGNNGERLNFPHSGSPFGCCGFHQPSQNLVNFFVTDASGLPISLSNPNWNASNANMTAAVTANMTVDPRLDWTVGRDGVPYKDWGTHNAGWIRAPAYGWVYSPRKNVHEKASGAQSNVGWNPQHLNGVNIHIYRYADLLLMLAEAEVEAGSLDAARTIVNEIRTRAGVTAQGPGVDRGTIAVPINDPRITWAKYTVGTYPAGHAAFANQAAARNAVRTERRLELAMEGQRTFDLRRWGLLETTMNAYFAKEKERLPHLAAAIAVTERHRLYPIPNIQIELSKSGGANTLTQNPGW